MKTNTTRARLFTIGFAMVSGLALVTSAESTTRSPFGDGFDPRDAGKLPLPTFDPNRVRLVSPLPDLIVSRADVIRSALISGKYRNNKVGYCVKNIGAAASAEATSAVFANTVVGDTGSPPRPPGGGDSLADLGNYFGHVPPLAPNQEHCDSFQFKTKGDIHNGPMFFNATTNARVIVDRGRRIGESNEMNNEAPTRVLSAP